MKCSILTVLTVAAFSLPLGSVSALGFSDALDGALTNLGDAISGVGYANPQKDRVRLLGKLDSAVDKILAGKFCDAGDKINDIKSKVVALRDARKAKIWDADGHTVQGLLDAADAVLDLLPCP